jgi:hypothetical protein
MITFVIARLGLSVVLAFAPAAQAQVISGRAMTLPAGGIGLAPLGTAPQLSAPSLMNLSAPSLSPLAVTALTPVPSAVMAAQIAAVPAAIAPVNALSAQVMPAAAAAQRPGRGVQVRFDELKAAFDEKKTEDAPPVAGAETGASTSLRPDAPGANSPAPNEPPKPPDAPRAKTLFGFARPLAFFLIAVVLAQVGIEASNAGLPPLIAQIFGNISVAADMGVAASIADLAGTIVAPLASKKLGLKRGYVWSTGLRVVTGGLIAGFLATSWITLPGLMALLAADYVLYGISYTLEKSIPAVIVDQDQGKLEKFKAVRQTAIEAVATVIPIATGVAIASLGFLPALIAFPVAMAAAAGLVALTLKLPAKIAGAAGAPLPGPEKGSTGSYLKSLGKGAILIARTPKLLFSLLAYSIVYTPMQIVYWFLAPAYALHVAHSATAAAAFAGTITGLYSFGSIFGALFMMRQQRKERDAAQMRKSMLRWTAMTAVGMALFGVLALPALTWSTLTFPALALLVFGIPETIARLKLESYFQSKAPKGAVADATAVLEGSASVIIAAGLWWFGKALAGAHITSFGWLMAAAAPLALPLLLLTWALARASRPRP